jgi:ACS family D-galactonate transporter-like MFS transporter
MGVAWSRFTPMTSTATHEAPTSARMNGVLFLLSVSVLINYIDRSNLSIAADLIKGELRISDLQLGALLSAFFWTYGCMQIPAGWLVDRFDVKWVFAAGFFLWSAATAATGLMHGFAALIVIRIILGMGESVAFPSYSKILGTYFKEARRGSANAAIIAGLALGPAIGMLVGGTVVGRFGWRPFFLALGLGSLLWLVPWLAWMPRQARVPANASKANVSLLDILCQRSAWGTCLGQFCINYCLYFLVTWLPTYLTRGRHFSMDRMARVGGLIFLLFAVASLISGKISDRWIAAGASTTRVRKTLLGVGSLGLGFSLATAAVAPDTILVWVLSTAGICIGISGGCCWTVTQTLAGPHAAGRWAGVQNFVGNFAGGVGPMLTGYLVGRTGLFYWPFVIAAVVSWVGALSWVFAVGPIEPVDWEKKLGAPRFRIDAAPATGGVHS